MRHKINHIQRVVAVFLSAVLTSSLLCTTALAVSIIDSNVFIKQSTTSTCTLASATMMLRRHAILDGVSDWDTITESAVNATAWVNGSGMRFSFTYREMSVVTQGIISAGYTTVSEKKNYFISMLNSHPEGIVIYAHSVPNVSPHAVLLTDYDSTTDTFYCADPSSSADAGRIKLANSTLPGSSLNSKIGNIKQIWYINSGSATQTGIDGPSNLPQYFDCNVRINCFNGQTVNLYNNPGDTSRADYFSLGQTVNSTCGMVRSDGSTWYRITANQNGIPKTFWLKYESGKMTVTNLMSKGPYTLTPKCAPGTRLDVKGGSAEDGANVQIYTSNGTAAQQWELTYLGNGYYTIISKASGKALDVAGASTESGANVQQYTPNGTNAQQWMLKDAGEGYYYIVPRVNTGLCLDVTGAGTADKTNVEIYAANGTDAQKWKLTVPEIPYTVTFNPNGGSISQSSKAVTTGQKYGDLPMPSRSGYIFDGWYTSANGGTQVTAATTVNLTGNQTLYARWKLNCSNHTYNADTCTNCGAKLPYDNGFDASAAGTYQVSENTAYIRTGPYQVKDLVGTMNRGETLQVVGSVINSYNHTWMKTADGYYVHADKLTLYSETQAQSYYVILDDGSVCSRIIVTNGETYDHLPTPAKEGYTFDGWYTAASGGVRVTSTTTVNLTGNQTLYAHWTKEEPIICSHVKGQLQYSDTSHPHYNHYTCSKCGESFTDYSVTPDRSCDSCWGPWSSWSATPVSASSTREVETRQVKVSEGHTEYRYGRYIDSTGTHDCWCGKYLEGLSYVSGGAALQYSAWTTQQYSTSGKDWSCGYCNGNHIGVHHTGTDGRDWWKEYLLPSGSYYWEDSRWVDAVYETQYRYRDWISD